jgi:hypothetical protein
MQNMYCVARCSEEDDQLIVEVAVGTGASKKLPKREVCRQGDLGL